MSCFKDYGIQGSKQEEEINFELTSVTHTFPFAQGQGCMRNNLDTCQCSLEVQFFKMSFNYRS